jgi:hypothetical protein
MNFAVSISELDRALLAGFLEGEAHLRIHEQNGGQSLGCQMILNQRDDEQDLLEWLLAITGVGRLRRVPAQRTSRPQISWIVDRQDDCRELLAMIEPCGFHGRRAAELRAWSHAVDVWTRCDGTGRRSRLGELRDELASARRFGGAETGAAPFRSPRQLRGYISGFVCAEGCFCISNGRPRFSIHLRQDDEPLLRLLAEETGLGKVRRHCPGPPLNPSATWTVAGRAELADLRDLLWHAGLTGRKLRQLAVWGDAVEELNRAARCGVRPRREALESAGEHLRALRAYRPPVRPELLQLPRRDLKAEALAALREWSRASAGKLSATDYMRWRREHPHAPARNTIARAFGSWYGALAAAGVQERAAASPETVEARRRGGEVRRDARRREQRARLVAAVRRFERENGRSPRALEFFRWRLDAKVSAPSQGAVYGLFPGGWAEVLQVAGATV